jgi:hypothetical protein
MITSVQKCKQRVLYHRQVIEGRDAGGMRLSDDGPARKNDALLEKVEI